jgi:glycosyltransferase involved in cell wall biosynthesis
MKVLHVSHSDLGGAGRAAYRTHRALLTAGVESRMAVIRKTADDPTVLQPLGVRGRLLNKFNLLLERPLMCCQHDPNSVMRSANLCGVGLGAWINRSDFDIVNMHWVGQSTLSLGEIAAIRKPIVWTMHDMWPFSGTEHYAAVDGPARWQSGYRGDRATAARGLDFDALVFALKRRLWRRQQFHLVSSSRWMASCAASSPLFARMPCRVIPNCLDLSVYKPLNRQFARAVFNLNPDRKYILFGARGGIGDPRKGFHLLYAAVQRLKDIIGRERENVELLVFGGGDPADSPDFGLPVHYLGNFADELSLALLYAAADVFAAPSMQDNLPYTVVEAMAAGTPCVAFAIGGMLDLVDDGVTGFLAPAFDTDAFANNIGRVLGDESGRFGLAARAKAEMQYAESVVAEQYLAWYRDVLNANRDCSGT